MAPDRLATTALAVSLLPLVVFFLRGRPKILATLWLVSFFVVPVWATITLGIGLPPATYVGLAVLPFAYFGPGPRVPLRWYDLLVMLFCLLCTLSAILNSGTLGAITTPILQWALGYAVARILWVRAGAAFMSAALAVACGVAAVLGLVEFFTAHNIFFSFPMGRGNGLYKVWAEEQIRAGFWRVEGAFGHSIAFGSVLAMCLPAVICSRLRPMIKAAISLLVGVTLVLTFSRLSQITALVGILLTLFLPGGHLQRRTRKMGIVAVVGFAALSLPFISATVEQAGDEAEGSAEYRDRLWSLLDGLVPFGPSPAAHVSPTGTLYFGEFRSIDNAFLLTGLTYGWLPLVLAVVLLAGGVVSILRCGYSAPLAGLLAQTPAVFSVAFITQYEVFYWAMVGMACAATAELVRGSDELAAEGGSVSRSPLWGLRSWRSPEAGDRLNPG
ncbi:hypothetical protein KEM60_00326 [Austwickia sp. TVS 96-490-7B]|uniref:hypothetical protein n=1 Tax=Austwickia sp. TVS 96-490-7B TaxID=2830843 RepID=UPI001C56BA48|nr:hypothetical protein [Austwickia sp. TVS 96-490-7B]MBW3084142.1 hypothetical protein [Austwickia sp. TVS 96-490-7B]